MAKLGEVQHPPEQRTTGLKTWGALTAQLRSLLQTQAVTRGISTGPIPLPAQVGDSNTFSPNGQGWCSAIEGTNINGVTGIQEGYLRTSAGGLVIYQGNDFWCTLTNSYDKKAFDNILDQPFNPDSLPCASPTIGINLGPPSATNPVGTSDTVTATLVQGNGTPATSVTVNFSVGGPNTGKTGTGTTNSNGQSTFTYTDTGGAGTDSIVAGFTDTQGAVHTSNTVNATWGTGGSACTTGGRGGSVGGVLLPINKLALAIPYVGLSIVMLSIGSATVILVGRARQRREHRK